MDQLAHSPKSPMRLLTIHMKAPKVVRLDKFLGEDFGRHGGVKISGEMKRRVELGQG